MLVFVDNKIQAIKIFANYVCHIGAKHIYGKNVNYTSGRMTDIRLVTLRPNIALFYAKLGKNFNGTKKMRD